MSPSRVRVKLGKTGKTRWLAVESLEALAGLLGHCNRRSRARVIDLQGKRMTKETGTGNDELVQMSNSTLIARSTFGGFLMGLANLVPGISGGTMLLAAGIYPVFIDALADMTRLKFRFRSMLVMGCVVGAAGLGILLLAGTLKELVVNQRWVMYSLFIGLTLGGLPIVWRMAHPATTGLIVAASLSLLVMVSLSILESLGIVGSGHANFLTLFFAGLAGASAMILPGVSGGYLLLLLGQYVPILNAIDQFKDAISARDIEAAMVPALGVLLPVGVGVVSGVVIVGNLLEWLLRRFRQVTLGVLIGLLLGSTVGLWPFQEGVSPEAGDRIKGVLVTQENLDEIDPEDWKTRRFLPTGAQVASSMLLVGLGFGVTAGISLIGGREPESK